MRGSLSNTSCPSDLPSTRYLPDIYMESTYHVRFYMVSTC